jgi:hypothetical protein
MIDVRAMCNPHFRGTGIYPFILLPGLSFPKAIHRDTVDWLATRPDRSIFIARPLLSIESIPGFKPPAISFSWFDLEEEASANYFPEAADEGQWSVRRENIRCR